MENRWQRFWRIHKKNCKKYGAFKMNASVITAPLWVPVFFIMAATGVILEWLGQALRRHFDVF